MDPAEAVAASRYEADRFLTALGEPGHSPMTACHVAVVVAHPDDETIGCGGQLRRLRGVTVAVVTDGAPGDLADARAYDFTTAEAYAAARARELHDALSIAGVSEHTTCLFSLPDQSSTFHLVDMTRHFVEVFATRAVTTAVTHAYEGGHPDHDATAFAVHAAAALSRRDGRPLGVVEMPFYHLGPAGMVVQRFASANERSELVIPLTEEERAIKRRMIAAHATQRETLAPFALDAERFRAAPSYDFTSLPNDDQLLYERFPWGMTGARWLTLARDAARQLGLGGDRGGGPWA